MWNHRDEIFLLARVLFHHLIGNNQINVRIFSVKSVPNQLRNNKSFLSSLQSKQRVKTELQLNHCYLICLLYNYEYQCCKVRLSIGTTILILDFAHYVNDWSSNKNKDMGSKKDQSWIRFYKNAKKR